MIMKKVSIIYQQCKVSYVTLRYVPKLTIPSNKTRINNSRLPCVSFQ